MGNNFDYKSFKNGISKIEDYIKEGKYEESKNFFEQNKRALEDIDNENIEKVLQLFLDKIKEEHKITFQNIIVNLKGEDKILLLFKLFYEDKLIDTLNDVNINDLGKNSKIKNIENEFEKLEREIKNINKIYKYIFTEYSKSILSEKKAHNYYKIGKMYYSNFILRKEESSEKLSEIIIYLEKCKSEYEKTKNKKIKLKDYENLLNTIKSHQNFLLGNESFKYGKYMEALNYYENINCNDSNLNEEKKKVIKLCYQNLGRLEEEKAKKEKEKGNINGEKAHYEIAKEYYQNTENNNKLFELRFIICKIEIEDIIKSYESQKEFVSFEMFFDILSKIKGKKYSKFISTDLLILLIRLSIISFIKNNLNIFIDNLKSFTQDKIENEKMNSIMLDLIFELKEFQKRDENNLLEYIKESLKPDNSEIRKIFYLSILII